MKISIFLASGIAVTTLLLGTVFGYYITPEYKYSMYQKNDMTLGAADRTYDLRYINAMIAHHRGAMLLAEQLAKNSTRPEMQALAKDILKGEPVLIAELYSWKESWYNDTKKVRDPIVPNLGAGDEKFDLRFLNAIIAHHEAGIIMTKETRQKSSRTEILNNADAVEAFLTGGIEKLKEIRASWYSL